MEVFLHSSQENDTTLEGRAKSDAREMQSFYRHYYQKYIQALQNAADKDRWAYTLKSINSLVIETWL